MCLGTLASAMLLGVMSLNISPAHFPGPGFGLATHIASQTGGSS